MAADRIVLPDSQVRRRAATDFETNLVVLAGAGTGKTSLLVERALNAIGSGVATMESIAAITFTEKAAGEMRERLAVGLDRLRLLAREGGPRDPAQEADRAFEYLTETLEVPEPELAARALSAMEQLDHGRVMTIHGFCSELLRAYPVESGVDPGFRVDSGEWAETVGRELWAEFVRRELGPDGAHEETWARLLSGASLSELETTARQLAGFGVPADLLASAGSGEALDLLRGEARCIVHEIDAVLDRSDDLTPLGANCLGGLRVALDALVEDGPEAFRLRLEADPELAKRLDGGGLGGSKKNAGEDAAREFKRVADQARALCRSVLRTNDELVGEMIGALEPFVREFRETYLARGLVGFDGLLALTRDLLRDRPEVRRRIKQRIGLLLVDEFQDTDPLQYEIVLFLAERQDDDAGDAFEARLAPGRLFVVGDAKQSIYRFRGADFAAYARALLRIQDEGGVKLELVGNFRSVPEIVEPVNDLFSAATGCWAESAHQPEYVPILSVRAANGEAPAVDVWTVDVARGTRANDRREAEGRVIADALKRWVEDEKRCAYRQITLLFRAFTNLPHYLRPLRERGIPFVVDGGRDFLKRPEVTQLMAILRAASNPADQASLLAYLRSPAGGVSDVELARHAESGGRWSWKSEPDEKRCPNIANAFRLLRDLWEETRDMPVDRFVRRVLARTRLLPLGAAAFEGAQRVANLQKLVAAAGELARDGSLSLDDVLEALEEGRLEEIKTDRPLADDAAEAVRITNIHRMKGLENDVIILPDLARQLRGPSQPKPVYVPTRPDGGPMLAIKTGSLQNTARSWYEMEDRRHGESEEVRVLYVALTRARERLVLVAAPPRGKIPWLEALAPWGYEAGNPPADGESLAGDRVRHRLWEPPKRIKPPGQEIPETATRAVDAYVAAVETLRESARAPLAAPSGLSEHRQARLGAGDGWTPRGARQSRDVGQAVGIALHRLLQRWNGSNPAGLTDQLNVLCEETSRETRTDRDALSSEATEILEAFLASDLPRRWAGLERLGAEIPLLVASEDADTVFRGSIDLLYRDANGEIVVADYKTDRRTDPAELREKYAAQLTVYADAVERAFNLDQRPRTELWLLRTGNIQPLDA